MAAAKSMSSCCGPSGNTPSWGKVRAKRTLWPATVMVAYPVVPALCALAGPKARLSAASSQQRTVRGVTSHRLAALARWRQLRAGPLLLHTSQIRHQAPPLAANKHAINGDQKAAQPDYTRRERVWPSTETPHLRSADSEGGNRQPCPYSRQHDWVSLSSQRFEGGHDSNCDSFAASHILASSRIDRSGSSRPRRCSTAPLHGWVRQPQRRSWRADRGARLHRRRDSFELRVRRTQPADRPGAL